MGADPEREAQVSERELDEVEYSGFKKRLANQRHGLLCARDDVRKAEQRAAYWLDEINITKRAMRRYEEKGLE